jgi:hypothetical protein
MTILATMSRWTVVGLLMMNMNIVMILAREFEGCLLRLQVLSSNCFLRTTVGILFMRSNVQSADFSTLHVHCNG